MAPPPFFPQLTRTSPSAILEPGHSCSPERAGKQWVKKPYPIRMKKPLEKRRKDLLRE
jgi:hypothetical protein